MSLTTPRNIRELQIKLYRKAKNEPGYRFYLLYDKIYREDILSHAYKLARANKGAPGVDGQSFEDIESTGLERWLTGIREELRNKTYRPQPVRRVKIPKPGGGERLLGIPCIKDRVVQTAVKLLIEPIFEAELEPNTYGYRPKRSARDAIQRVHKLLGEGYTDVVDADLSKYFDTIPHCELMQCVARRIVDRNVVTSMPLVALKSHNVPYRARTRDTPIFRSARLRFASTRQRKSPHSVFIDASMSLPPSRVAFASVTSYPISASSSAISSSNFLGES